MLLVTFHRNFDSFFISDFLVPFWASVSNGAPLLSKKPFSRPNLFSNEKLFEGIWFLRFNFFYRVSFKRTEVQSPCLCVILKIKDS